MYKFIIKFKFKYWDNSDDSSIIETLTFIGDFDYFNITDDVIKKYCIEKLESLKLDYPVYIYIISIKQIKIKTYNSD